MAAHPLQRACCPKRELSAAAERRSALLCRFRARRRELPTDDVPSAATYDTYDEGAFEALIAPLPDGAQAALRLRFVDDLDYDGIADRLGCSTVAARQRVSTAVRSLRETFA